MKKNQSIRTDATLVMTHRAVFSPEEVKSLSTRAEWLRKNPHSAVWRLVATNRQSL